MRIETQILYLISKINEKCTRSIIGVHCLDSQICSGFCCDQSIDIPRALRDHYIHQGWAQKSDFFKGDVLSYRIKTSPITHHCTFFDLSINGCRIYRTLLKPPQCGLYPIKYDTLVAVCRSKYHFKIDKNQLDQIHQLFREYQQLCNKEKHWNFAKLTMRYQLYYKLYFKIQKYPPNRIIGITHSRNSFDLKFCSDFSWDFLPICDQCGCQQYLECAFVCKSAANRFSQIVYQKIKEIIEFYGKMPHYSLANLEKILLL